MYALSAHLGCISTNPVQRKAAMAEANQEIMKTNTLLIISETYGTIVLPEVF